MANNLVYVFAILTGICFSISHSCHVTNSLKNEIGAFLRSRAKSSNYKVSSFEYPQFLEDDASNISTSRLEPIQDICIVNMQNVSLGTPYWQNALCPWTWRRNVAPKRVPPVIFTADCTCRHMKIEVPDAQPLYIDCVPAVPKNWAVSCQGYEMFDVRSSPFCMAVHPRYSLHPPTIIKETTIVRTTTRTPIRTFSAPSASGSIIATELLPAPLAINGMPEMVRTRRVSDTFELWNFLPGYYHAEASRENIYLHGPEEGEQCSVTVIVERGIEPEVAKKADPKQSLCPFTPRSLDDVTRFPHQITEVQCSGPVTLDTARANTVVEFDCQPVYHTMNVLKYSQNCTRLIAEPYHLIVGCVPVYKKICIGRVNVSDDIVWHIPMAPIIRRRRRRRHM